MEESAFPCRRRPFDIELIRRIHARYPQIELEWLLCGPRPEW
nr:hypothetical protein [Alistipes megaguti]